jgi:acyl transferase domain-containing protein
VWVATDTNHVFLMGGQGTQYFGMARDLYVNAPAFRASLDRMDAYVRRIQGISVLDYVYDPKRGPADVCDDLPATSAAIVMIEVALFHELAVPGLRPSAVVGSSLGELAAMAALGYVDVGVVLDVVVDVARRLVRVAGASGGMLAVLGDPALHTTALRGAEIASINHGGHFVLAGDAATLDAAERALGERGLVTARLPVRVAFHSAHIEAAREAVIAACRGMRFERPDSILFSSALAARRTRCTPELCWEIVRSPIRFTDAVSAVPEAEDAVHVDLSPSSTLAAIMRGSHPGRVTRQVITPFHNEIGRLRSLVPAQGGLR